jgi:hypothetical protein
MSLSVMGAIQVASFILIFKRAIQGTCNHAFISAMHHSLRLKFPVAIPFFYGVLVAIGTGGATIPLVDAMMSKWFEKCRGLAISLALSGACLGQFILVPFVTDYGVSPPSAANMLALSGLLIWV